MLQAASPRSHLASSRCIPSTLQPQILLDRKGLLALAAHPPAPREQSVSVSNASAQAGKAAFGYGTRGYKARPLQVRQVGQRTMLVVGSNVCEVSLGSDRCSDISASS